VSVAAGKMAPDFTAATDTGEALTLSSLRGKTIVLFFYPKDDTSGCTKEACSFRDSYQSFTDAGAEVIGVSSDDGASHQKFAEKFHLPFTLVSDTGGGDALPLLAFRLEQLAHGTTRGDQLTQQRYDDIGGVQGALST